MTAPINQEHEDVLNFAHSLPSGLTKEQIYVRIHERAAKEAAEQVDAAIAAHNEAVGEQERLAAELSSCRAAAAAGLPAGWKSLNDVQWMNIVNHDHAYHSFSKDEAVHEAVKRTEAKLRELNSPALPAAPAPESQPAALDVLRGMICWTEGEEGDLCQCVKTADQVTNPEGVFVRLSTLRAALQAPVPAAQEGQDQPRKAES